MLSAATERRLKAAHEAETGYIPAPEICVQLGSKVLVMVVGPVAVGKSYIMNRVVETNTDFSRVPVFTTREARPDDESGMFDIYPHNDESVNTILDKIAARQVVQYAIHPTSGKIYGTNVEHYSNTYNLLPTLSHVVDSMRSLPFQSTPVIGLSTHPSSWQTWLDKRYPIKNNERHSRIGEAILSLGWLTDPAQEHVVQWVNNYPAAIDKTIDAIVNIVKHNGPGDEEAAANARLMLEYARENQ